MTIQYIRENYEKLDPWKILGLEKDASKREIKSAYRKLAKKWHPDRNPSPKAEDAFKKVNWAYNFLMSLDISKGFNRDKAKGNQYDDEYLVDEDALFDYIVENIYEIFEFPKKISYKDLIDLPTDPDEVGGGAFHMRIEATIDFITCLKLGKNIAKKKLLKSINERFDLSGDLFISDALRPNASISLYIFIYDKNLNSYPQMMQPEITGIYNFDGNKTWVLSNVLNER